MPAFVISYNRRTGEATVLEFAGPDGHKAAFQQRMELENDRTDSDIEIVSLVSDSLETIKHTHSRYFKRSAVLTEA